MNFKIKVSTIWEFGQRKDSQGNPHQEDSMFPIHQQSSPDSRLFILCDGMGGHDAGEVASATVCETMSRHIMSECPNPEGGFSDSIVARAVEASFAALDRKATELGADPGAKKKMGTTMTMLKLHSGGVTIAHMGDSRVYHIRSGKDAADTRVMWRTEDHSLVNALLRSGEITPDEARNFDRKNVVTRALQPFNERPPKADVHLITDVRPGDFFYLCSDGMLENMDDRQLCFFFSQGVSDEDRVHMLVKATAENRDNHSAIIVKIVEVQGVQPAPVLNASPMPQPVKEATVPPQPVAPQRPPQRPAPRPTPPQPGHTQPHYPTQPSDNRSRKSLLWAVAIILLLAVAGIGTWKFSHKDKQSTESQAPADTEGTANLPSAGAPQSQGAKKNKQKNVQNDSRPQHTEATHSEQRTTSQSSPTGSADTLEKRGKGITDMVKDALKTVVPAKPADSEETDNEPENEGH